MSRLWWLGAIALAVVVTIPVLMAVAEEGAPPRLERRGGERAAGEGRRPEGPPPPPPLTDEQKAALEPAIKEFEAAVAKFQEEAIKVLGERAGRLFVMQTAARIVRPAPPREGERRLEGERRPEGERRFEGGELRRRNREGGEK